MLAIVMRRIRRLKLRERRSNAVPQERLEKDNMRGPGPMTSMYGVVLEHGKTWPPESARKMLN
jgi:hypothetical protein